MSKKEKPAVKIEEKARWAFDTVSKCPRCGTTDTICQHTDNIIGRQYRKCQRAICRFNYSVNGKKI